VYDCLVSRGIDFGAPCAGNGWCGGCGVLIVAGEAVCHHCLARVPDKCAERAAAGEYVYACRSYVTPGLVIETVDREISVLTAFDNRLLESANGARTSDGRAGNAGRTGHAVAVDVGTTTLAAALIDLDARTVIRSAACVNPNRLFGADVMSRLSACMNDDGALKKMRSALVGALRSLITGVSGGERLLPAAVTGNTVMLHILRGVSPVGMAAYPFKPAFLDAAVCPGTDLGLDSGRTLIAPSASAFIGADVVGGVYAAGLTSLARPSLLIDLGTNGECVLCTGYLRGARLLAASAAGGPALEGGGISCGVAAVSGAICRAALAPDGVIEFVTVNGTPPVGVCGSGIIDLVAVWLDLFGENGVLTDACPKREIVGRHVSDSGSFIKNYDNTGLFFDRDDLHGVMLAKAALRASVEYLLEHARLKADELDRVYLAGGFGKGISAISARRIGLLPDSSASVIAPGNLALAGSALALIDGIDPLRDAARKINVVDCSGEETFDRLFIEHLGFADRKKGDSL